jgi:hypothetical protein
MRIHPFLIMLAMTCALNASAQVEVEMVLDQDKFLPAEQLLAGVRIVNRSGQPLNLGAEKDWVQFSIQKVEGGAVHKLSDPPVDGAFRLESGERATVKVDIAPCFDLRMQGRYAIIASVKVDAWSKVVVSRPLIFEIVEGTKLWEQEIGVPLGFGRPEPPELRKYTLQQANYLKSLRLYLRVSASGGNVLKLINVGPMIGFGQPEPQVDRQSRLHLLYQKAAKSFSYLVVNPDGDILVRQTYEYADSRPRLRLDEGGIINVTGGARKMAADDLPPPSDSQAKSKELSP